MLVFHKIWRVSFSCNTRFEIHLFPSLPKIYFKKSNFLENMLSEKTCSYQDNQAWITNNKTPTFIFLPNTPLHEIFRVDESPLSHLLPCYLTITRYIIFACHQNHCSK